MKKYIYTLALALILPFMTLAQSPANRIPKTVVADVLAQMPSKNITVYNDMMRDLVASGKEGVTILAGMMQTPGNSDNVAVEYAINGLSNYVTAAGFEDARKTVSQIYADALDKASDPDIKAFFLTQLIITAGNDMIGTATKYAVDPQQYNDALRILVAVNTPESKKAVIELAEKIPSKAAAAKAIGDLGITECEPLLLQWFPDTDPAVHKAVLYALSRTGSPAVAKTLQNEAAKTGYQYEASEATHAYLSLIERLQDTKAASKLLKNEQPSVRATALAILVKADPAKAPSYILSALSNESRPYRNAALTYAGCPQIKANVEKAVIAKLAKYPAATQTDIINWLGMQKSTNAVKAIIPYVTAEDAELAAAAMNALVRTGDSEGIGQVVNALKTNDDARISAAKTALSWSPMSANTALIAAFNAPDITPAGKSAIIDLASTRINDESWKNKILELCLAQIKGSTDENPVSNSAYKALERVAGKTSGSTLSAALKDAPAAYVPDVQKALGYVVTLMGSEGLPFLENQLNAAPADKKNLYYAVLPYTKSKAALSLIEKAINSSDAKTKDAAVQALTTWNNADALDLLYKVVTDPALKARHTDAVRKYTVLVTNGGALAPKKLIDLRKMLDVAQTAEQKNILLQAVGTCPAFNSVVVAGAYLDNADTRHAAGTAIMNVALKDKSINGPQIRAILQKVMDTRGGGDAVYDKEAIQKHMQENLNGEEGYVSIFNGKDLSGWKGLVANPIARAKMTPDALAKAQERADEIMRKGWKVENGNLIFTGHGDNLCTEKKYGDFEMYVDWMITAEGDAGIYLRGTPQVQIWDTSRVDVGAQVGSGGLYNNSTHPSKPTSLADNKIGDWNTFYIKMVGERVTVILNGVKVVDNVIMENYWNRNIPIFTEEQLELQAHGTLLAYRDVYVKELEPVQLYDVTPEEKAAGFKPLFDGVSMHNWIGNTTDYIAENGTISLYPQNGGGGNLYTKDEYKDFVFRFEFQLTPAANNGLGIRTPLEGDAAYVGMELQILDNEHPVYKDLEIYQYHGSVYGVIPAKRGFLKPVGEWNQEEVIVKGNHVTVILNGETIMDGDIAEASKNGTIDHKDHPGLKNKTGHIGFLGHGSPVKFRNIRIKEL